MAEKKSKKTEPKKTKVYECAHYDYEYDDLGKYCWCRNRKMNKRECDVRYKYCQRFCPGYKKGQFIGSWELSSDEKMYEEEFKKKMVSEAVEREKKERALLKYLKEKYEP